MPASDRALPNTFQPLVDTASDRTTSTTSFVAGPAAGFLGCRVRRHRPDIRGRRVRTGESNASRAQSILAELAGSNRREKRVSGSVTRDAWPTCMRSARPARRGRRRERALRRSHIVVTSCASIVRAKRPPSQRRPRLHCAENLLASARSLTPLEVHMNPPLAALCPAVLLARSRELSFAGRRSDKGDARPRVKSVPDAPPDTISIIASRCRRRASGEIPVPGTLSGRRQRRRAPTVARPRHVVHKVDANDATRRPGQPVPSSISRLVRRSLIAPRAAVSRRGRSSPGTLALVSIGAKPVSVYTSRPDCHASGKVRSPTRSPGRAVLSSPRRRLLSWPRGYTRSPCSPSTYPVEYTRISPAWPYGTTVSRATGRRGQPRIVQGVPTPCLIDGRASRPGGRHIQRGPDPEGTSFPDGSHRGRDDGTPAKSPVPSTRAPRAAAGERLAHRGRSADRHGRRAPPFSPDGRPSRRQLVI